MRALPGLLLLASLSIACNKDKPAEGDKPFTQTEGKPDKKSDSQKKGGDEKKGDEDGEKKADKKKADKKKPEPPKKEKADAEKIAAYWKAMTDGRKATVAKKYDDAYAAFDKALKVIPDDPRAISERGYAKLLAKDYKGAVADLDKAVTHTTDKKLLGQIYYNYGLAAEGRGDEEAARAAFAKSDAYNPTPAAKKKLAGKSACTATIEEHKPWAEARTFASWKDAYADAAQAYDGGLDPWTDEATSMKALCKNPWKKGAACIATLGGVIVEELRVYVPTAAGKVVGFDLEIVGGRCGGAIDPKLVSDEGDVTHVSWRAEQGVPVFVTEKNGEMVPCGEKDSECTTACGDAAASYADLFIAKDKGESMLYVGRAEEGGKDPLKVTVEMPTVTIKGKGCDTERPLAK